MPKVAQPVCQVLGLEPRPPDSWPGAPSILVAYFLGRPSLCSQGASPPIRGWLEPLSSPPC